MFSPAFSGGLIEAASKRIYMTATERSFPPRSAGASLKQSAPPIVFLHSELFSPAFSGGLIEAPR